MEDVLVFLEINERTLNIWCSDEETEHNDVVLLKMQILPMNKN